MKIYCHSLLRTCGRNLHSPLFVGFCAHLQFQFSAFIQFIAVKPALVIGFAIEGGRLDILLPRSVALGFYNKLPARILMSFKVDFYTFKLGTAQLISGALRHSTLHIEQAHCGQHIP